FKLPRPVETGVAIGSSPYIAPLAEIGVPATWCVLLTNRKVGRILRGSSEGLVEATRVTDDVHGRHSQGGWSQARYQRSVEKEVDDHIARVAQVLFRSFQRIPFDRLLVGCTEEVEPEVRDSLHPYLLERYVGRVDVDVENTTPEQVLHAAAEPMEREDRKRERAALDRLAEVVGSGGRGAAGLDDVLAVLHERRVEILLYEPGLTAAGAVCPQCGWMSTTAETCPADGSTLERRDDVVEVAIEVALAQSAEVLPVRIDQGLEAYGGIGAVLRF
ncbi:MAG: peptide chain release factor subunit 1, partial [Solirubrobacteraceae bacterium]|nr:peptide chain release factor subunit 1 [Solirubrobacteraceae bacterium]